jgi:predicted nucleic acid-binding protein
MTDPVFVDTNVLIYKADLQAPVKQQRALLWMTELWAGRAGRLSFLVLQEYFAQATHQHPELRDQVRSEIRDLLAWKPVNVDGALLNHAWKIQDRYKLSFWDSLIVAAAKAASCRWLLTEDLQPGQNLDGIIVVNPFLRTPDQLPV